MDGGAVGHGQPTSIPETSRGEWKYERAGERERESMTRVAERETHFESSSWKRDVVSEREWRGRKGNQGNGRRRYKMSCKVAFVRRAAYRYATHGSTHPTRGVGVCRREVGETKEGERERERE